MMSIHVSGHLVKDPVAKTSANGRSYVSALILASSNNTEALITLLAFDSELQTLLNNLKRGDSVSAMGSATARAYLDKQDVPAVGLTVMCNRLMAMTEGKAKPRPKEVSTRTGNNHQVAGPREFAPIDDALPDF